MLPKEVRRRLMHLTEEAAKREGDAARVAGAETGHSDAGYEEEAGPDLEVAPALFPLPAARQASGALPRDGAWADWARERPTRPGGYPLTEGGADLADWIGGGARSSGEGSYWLSEIPLAQGWPEAARRLSSLAEHLEAPRADRWPRELAPVAGHTCDHLLFLDIETAGAWTAAPLFLIGTLDLAGGLPLLRFFLARDYEEERWLLEAFSGHRDRFPVMVTFNGKTFDWPFILDRLRYHNMAPGSVVSHLDILPLARKRWRNRLPNCRLLTLERAICRRLRLDDLPSREIPAMYHRFVAEEAPEILVPILRHNAWDLVTTAELLLVLLSGREPLEP